MKNKKINSYILVVIFLISLGGVVGYYAMSLCTKCIVINAKRDIFYGKFAKELEQSLISLGYKFNCPNFLPKTVIDFVYTNNNKLPSWYRKRNIDTNIALVGDCFDGYNIDFLKEYDFLLVVKENRFGYIAMFNFKAIHFPIQKYPYKELCNHQYEGIDIKDVANQLDYIIKRIKG